jgi:predicted TIM-barrel fold metal-dependent hydrolase
VVAIAARAAAEQAGERRERRAAPQYELIDCDVHQSIGDYTQLHPYLPVQWRRYVSKSGFGGATSGILRGAGSLYRQDARPPGGGEPGSDPAWLRQQLIERYHVRYAILNGGNILGLGTLPDADYASALASAYNDWTIATWLTEHNADGRFKAAMLVAPQDPQGAAREIDRVGDHPHIVQVLFTTATGIPLGHRWFHPIYEAAERHGLPVAVHPGAEGRAIAGQPTAAGWISKYIEWHTCLPQTAMTHAVSLVCQGVFEKFPRLKVVLVECGQSWLAHVMWRLDKNYKALRVEVPWLKRLPSEYLKEHIRLTTQPIEEPPSREQFLQMLEMIDARRTLMLSTDYPHWDFDDPIAAFKHVPEDMKRRIYYQNAAELYGL